MKKQTLPLALLLLTFLSVDFALAAPRAPRRATQRVVDDLKAHAINTSESRLDISRTVSKMSPEGHLEYVDHTLRAQEATIKGGHATASSFIKAEKRGELYGGRVERLQVDSSGQVSLTQFELAPSRGSWGKTEIHDDSQFGIHVTRNFKTAKGDVKLKEHYRVGPIDEKNWRIMGSMNLDLPNGKSIQTGVGPGQDGGNTLIVRSANHDGPNAHKLLSAFIAKDSGYPVYHRIQGDDYSARVVTSEGFELKFNLVKNPMNDKLEYQLVSKTKLADNELAQHLGSVKDYPSRIGRQTPPSDNSRVNGLE